MPSRRLFIEIEAFDAQAIRGEVHGADDAISSAAFELHADGKLVQTIECFDIQPGVGKHRALQKGQQFGSKIPSWLFDDLEHDLELRAAAPASYNFKGVQSQTCKVRICLKRYVTRGSIEGFRNGAIEGWLFAIDKQTEKTAGYQEVLVSLGLQPAALIAASGFRPDIAALLSCDPNCGFSFVPPIQLLSGTTVEFSFSAVSDGSKLDNSPFRISFPEMEIFDAIRELQLAADSIFTELWHLRANLQALTPKPVYSLKDYNIWAKSYFDGLSKLRGSVSQGYKPLVSVICPTFKPRHSDFRSAITSVISQSYNNWELIIINDGSRDAALESTIRDFARREPRIRYHRNEHNMGISAASNVGLQMARGRYVAFLDHDDLLVDLALELMVLAAGTTGAKLLYSDEDKIDDNGVFSEVNLKPDYNYRLLLSQNYICHFLMFERSLLSQTGLLDSECDGAQDYDLVLRLIDKLRPSDIFHVPEILYHWRKTPASTASAGSAKPYTVQAGMRALSKHLFRNKIAARISSPALINCYKITMKVDYEPKVTIIIPFREQVGVTKECVESIVDKTGYKNFEIVLVDNWSTSVEAAEFLDDVCRRHRTTVIRVEEPYNFSRLNNVAVALTEGDLVLFLNNDVVVMEESWLTVMVGEMQLDPTVGVVGNKLVYGNGQIQHAGVVLGVGGVADHSMRGASLSDPGYAVRGISAQEFSAVTAACMLCRRTTFNEAGGFDEVDLRVAFNDVDLCLKAQKLGRKVVWTPYSVVVHHESLSRGSDFTPNNQPRFFHEIEVMRHRWANVLSRDRFYNPHFSLRSGIFQDLGSPEIVSSTRDMLGLINLRGSD